MGPIILTWTLKKAGNGKVDRFDFRRIKAVRNSLTTINPFHLAEKGIDGWSGPPDRTTINLIVVKFHSQSIECFFVVVV